jgi:hypothetical protein
VAPYGCNSHGDGGGGSDGRRWPKGAKREDTDDDNGDHADAKQELAHSVFTQEPSRAVDVNDNATPAKIVPALQFVDQG